MLAGGLCRGCRVRDHDIARLQRRVAELEQEQRRLQRRNARLKKDNDRLRGELDEARRQAHRQASPFRRRTLKKHRKKAGRRRGHAADLRPVPTPERIDRVVNVPCRLCPDCNVELVEPRTSVQYQTDLPPIVPVVTQFNIESGWCPCCRRRVQGRHPEQTSNATGAAGNTLGPVVLHVAPSTFVRAEQRLAELAKPTYDLLLDALRRCHVVHADETGWRVNAVNGWLWVFSNKDTTSTPSAPAPAPAAMKCPSTS